MKRFLTLLLPVLVLTFAASLVSWLLLQKHVRKGAGPTWFSSVCESAEDGGANCDKVLASRWGCFPPLAEDEPAEQCVLPVAYLGLAYFSALFIWYVIVGPVDYGSRRWHLLPTLLVGGGVVGSLFFLGIMFTKLEEWCPWCLVTHLCNFAIFVLTIFLWPRRPKRRPAPPAAMSIAPPTTTAAGLGPAGPSAAAAASASVPEPALAGLPATATMTAERTPNPASGAAAGHGAPSQKGLSRLALAAIAVAIAVGSAEYHATSAAILRAGLDKVNQDTQSLKAQLGKYESYTMMLLKMFVDEKERKIVVRPDDPVRSGGELALKTVIFSDFQCPHCQRYATYLEETVRPLFDDKLTIVFKHYPSSNTCNAYVKSAFHPYACDAARAAEAARLQGGNDAFWKAHDLLFARQKQLGSMDYAALAGELDLDPERFVADMKSEAVNGRVQEDIEQAHQLTVTATPTIFVAGRKVDKGSITLTNFWEALAGRYKAQLARQLARQRKLQVLDQPRAPSAPAPPTPGNPGRPGAE